MLRGGNSGEKFRLGGARSGDRLRLASVGNGAATQEEGLAGSGSAVTQIICMHSIEKCNGFLGVHSGKSRQLGIHCGPDEVGRGKRGVWLGPTACDAPVFSSSEVFSDLFECSEVMVMRASGELRWRNGGVANVWPTRNISIQQFTKERATGKTTLSH